MGKAAAEPVGEADTGAKDAADEKEKEPGKKGGTSPPRKKKVVLTPDQAEEVITRLSHYEPRPIYEQTPGPYPVKYNPNARRVPFVFRTSGRFGDDLSGGGGSGETSTGPRPMLTIEDCQLVLPRGRDVVISSGPRFPKQKCETSNASKYDVEKGLKAIEPRAFTVVLAQHADQDRPQHKRTPSPTAQASGGQTKAHADGGDPSSSSSSLWYSQQSTRGRISSSPRHTDEFFLLRTCSPGPIYTPNVDAVRPSPVYCKFSAAMRTSSTQSVSSGSQHSDSMSAVDLQKQYMMLSTWETAPSVKLRAPKEVFRNPNKQKCPPPPPADDGGPPDRSGVASTPARRSARRERMADVMSGRASLMQTSSGKVEEGEEDEEGNMAAHDDVKAPPQDEAIVSTACRPQSATALRRVINTRADEKEAATRPVGSSRPASALSRAEAISKGVSSLLSGSSPFSTHVITDLKLATIDISSTLRDDQEQTPQHSERTLSSVGYSLPSSAVVTKLRVARDLSSTRGNDISNIAVQDGSPKSTSKSSLALDLRGSYGGSYSRAAAQEAAAIRMRAVKRRAAYPARESHMQRASQQQFWASSSSLL